MGGGSDEIKAPTDVAVDAGGMVLMLRWLVILTVPVPASVGVPVILPVAPSSRTSPFGSRVLTL